MHSHFACQIQYGLNKQIQLPGDYSVQKEYILEDNDYVAKNINSNNSSLSFERLNPGEYKIFELSKM